MDPSLLEDFHKGIVTITFNRPERLNAYDMRMLVHLQQSIERYSQREDAKVLVLAGDGSAFCTGVDIRHLIELMRRGDLKSFRRMADLVRQIILLLRRIPQASIASIDGVACDGGLNFALACDFRVASRRSTFGYPMGRFGWSPEIGTAFTLLPLAGPGRFLEVASDSDLISAEKAMNAGLLTEITSPEQLIDRTIRLARKASSNPPLLNRLLKRSVQKSLRPLEESLDSEFEARVRCFLNQEILARLDRFLENGYLEVEKRTQ